MGRINKFDTKGLKSRIFKVISFFIFYILPKRASRIYISLAIVALIYELKSRQFRQSELCVKKLSKVLQIAVNDDIMVLPNSTLLWLWTESTLNTDIKLLHTEYQEPLKEVVADDILFRENFKAVLDTLIDNLPPIFKHKLNLGNRKERIKLKHNVMEAFIFT